jgi:hypothetical protein
MSRETEGFDHARYARVRFACAFHALVEAWHHVEDCGLDQVEMQYRDRLLHVCIAIADEYRGSWLLAGEAEAIAHGHELERSYIQAHNTLKEVLWNSGHMPTDASARLALYRLVQGARLLVKRYGEMPRPLMPRQETDAWIEDALPPSLVPRRRGRPRGKREGS